MGLVALLGVILERAAYRPLRESPRLSAVVSALGASIFLQNALMLIYGARYQVYPEDVLPRDDGATSAALQFPLIRLVVLAASWCSWPRSTSSCRARGSGTAIRAAAIDQDAARLMGIDVNRVIRLVFLIGAGAGRRGRADGGALLRADELHHGLDLRDEGLHRGHPGRHREHPRRHGGRPPPGRRRGARRRPTSRSPGRTPSPSWSSSSSSSCGPPACSASGWRRRYDRGRPGSGSATILAGLGGGRGRARHRPLRARRLLDRRAEQRRPLRAARPLPQPHPGRRRPLRHGPRGLLRRGRLHRRPSSTPATGSPCCGRCRWPASPPPPSAPWWPGR